MPQYFFQSFLEHFDASLTFKKLCRGSGTLLLGSNGQSRITTHHVPTVDVVHHTSKRSRVSTFLRNAKDLGGLFDLLRRVLDAFDTFHICEELPFDLRAR